MFNIPNVASERCLTYPKEKAQVPLRVSFKKKKSL